MGRICDRNFHRGVIKTIGKGQGIRESRDNVLCRKTSIKGWISRVKRNDGDVFCENHKVNERVGTG